MNYILRPAARADLASIWAYTAQRWAVDQADNYITGITSRIESAARTPEIGSPMGGLPSAYRKAAFESHRILYRITDRDMIVVRILHARQDVPETFADD
ncbi:type II toxin-antitoxin system RelE/ParE family toxin [Qipengyuania sp. SM2507]